MKDEIMIALGETDELLAVANDTAYLISMIDFVPAAQRRAFKNLRKLIRMARDKTSAAFNAIDRLPSDQIQGLGGRLSQADCDDIQQALRDYRTLAITAVTAENMIELAGLDRELAIYLVSMASVVRAEGKSNVEL